MSHQYTPRPPPPPLPPRAQTSAQQSNTLPPAINLIPDTHTAIFTRIPRTISKSWSGRPISSKTLLPVEFTDYHHESSIITRIDLKVEFNTLLAKAQSLLGNESDAGNDKILAWKEARLDFANLEQAISDVISKIVIRAGERCRSRQTSTLDGLTLTDTRFEMANENLVVPDESTSQWRDDQSRIRSVAFSDVSTIQGKTILPDDSASVAVHRSPQSDPQQVSLNRVIEMLAATALNAQRPARDERSERHRNRRSRSKSRSRLARYMTT